MKRTEDFIHYSQCIAIHSYEATSKFNRVLACIKIAFTHLNSDGFFKLYKAMMRLIIEYANIIWVHTFCCITGDWKECSIVQPR